MDIVIVSFDAEDHLGTGGNGDRGIGGHRLDLGAILSGKENISRVCGGRTIVNSFDDRVLADEIPEKIKKEMEIPGFKFYAPLELTFDTDQFMHGADMLPGIINGIDNFLAIKRTSLREIKQVIFKTPIHSDIVCSILPAQDIQLQKKSNMHITFMDNENNEYFLYAQDISKAGLNREREHICLQNKLAMDVLLERRTANRKIELGEHMKSVESHIEYPLLDQNISMDVKNNYKQKMSENKGFMLGTVRDMVESLCGKLIDRPGYAAKYENIHRARHIDMECFFDGTLKLMVEQTTDPKKVNNRGRHQYKFSLVHKDKEMIVSGMATFWIKEGREKK